MAFLIAIDGHAASGKGTIAKSVAEHFNFAYLDTGLIYRAVAKIALSDPQGSLSKKTLIGIARSFDSEYLKLENLRSDEIGIQASRIATIVEVRKELVKFQRNFAEKGNGSVLDGRDIGTKILPHAQLKMFITADLNVRALRRYRELKKSNNKLTLDKVMDDLSQRDWLDSTREHAPLKISEDAYLIDTSELSIEASINYAIDLVNEIK